MRYFLSTGEASGELSATLLLEAIRANDPSATFNGIGSERMRAAGVTLFADHAGWASMGPLAAIPRIPRLYMKMRASAAHIAQAQYDLVILVDFGAFNVRLAKTLRDVHGYDRPVLYLYPPGAWLDNERRAREIARLAVPLVGFRRQYDLYKRLDLPVVFFGNPLVSRYTQRAPRPAPPHDGGTIAILPGSRPDELRHHVARLRSALGLLREQRPNIRALVAASDARNERYVRHAFAGEGGVDIVAGAHAALAQADAAFVASGTAVLECALLGVPSVAFYVIAPILVRHARRVYSGRFITLPNLLVNREIVPELLQDDATPQRLARAMETVLNDPSHQVAQFGDVRTALGSPDALERCARFATALAAIGAR